MSNVNYVAASKAVGVIFAIFATVAGIVLGSIAWGGSFWAWIGSIAGILIALAIVSTILVKFFVYLYRIFHPGYEYKNMADRYSRAPDWQWVKTEEADVR